MTTSELESRGIAISMRKSVENLVISSQDAIGQSISQALTFSGVITQHANQIIQENRSISRSPSPSLRSAESTTDILDNDKSEGSINLPCHAAGDSSSVSSASDLVTVLNAPAKPDKASPNPAARGSEGGGRTKKKSWYNALYPTYKSKSDDFKRLFKDLPDDERLIVDYSCALQKDILVHGRLYASQNYLCFYASIFGWETSMTLRWKDVTAITKEKTALVIPNAILVCTEGEKNFITSFSGRDKAYLMLFRIWQNALMDQPITSQEIWQWVHTCYGEELGFNSDDECDEPRRALREPAPDLPDLPPDAVPEDVLVSSMEASGGDEQRSTRSTSHGRDSSPPLAVFNQLMSRYVTPESRAGVEQMFQDYVLIEKHFSQLWDCDTVEGCEIAQPAILVTNGDAAYREEEGGDTLPTDMSDTSDSEPDKLHNMGEAEKCTCAHEGKLVLRQEFPFNIDQMFTMIFTNSKFNLELLAARGTTDYVQAPWQPQAGLKCRQVSYTLGLTSGPIGPKEVQVTETQIMNKCSKPGALYSIDASSQNAGIPYADYFTMEVHYCMLRVSESVTDLSIYAAIKYKKTMWPMVKAILEKNAVGGVEEFARLLESRLLAEAEPAPANTRKRRTRRLPASVQESAAGGGAAVGVVAGAGARGAALAARGSALAAPAHTRGRARGRHSWWLAGILVLLLLINALLYCRLYYHHAPKPFDIDDLHDRMSSLSGSQMSEWSALLEQHSVRQRGQLLAWRDALDRTVAHLTQTEQALTKLLETIKPSLERAQAAADDTSHAHDTTSDAHDTTPTPEL